jgi:cytochrome P450
MFFETRGIFEQFASIVSCCQAGPIRRRSDNPVLGSARAYSAQAPGYASFRPGRVNLLTPRTQTFTSQLLDHIENKSEFDAVSDLAHPVTLEIIAELLGIPIEPQPMLKAWSDRVFSSVRESLMLAGAFLTCRLDTSGSNGAAWRRDFFPIRAIESSVPDSSADAIVALRSYFSEGISQRRATPGDDLISVLASAQGETDTLSLNELLALVLLLLFAGDTTTNLIANGLVALSTHPDRLGRLRLVPEVLTSNAVEEVLRYDSPVQMVMRFCTRDTHIAETAVPGGAVVLVLISAATGTPRNFIPRTALISRAIRIITWLLAMEFTPVSVPTWPGCRAESYLGRGRTLPPA